MGNHQEQERKAKGIFRHKEISEQEELHIKYQLSGLHELLLFVGAHAYKNIASINLENSSIGATGCRLMIQGKWINLRNININFNKIGNEGCVHLSKSHWPLLKNLNLIGNAITDEGCHHISKGHWPQIKQMEINSRGLTCIRRNKITQNGVDILKLGYLKRDDLLRSDDPYNYRYNDDKQGDFF